MYDASFKWWQWTVDYLLTSAGMALNMTETQVMGFAQKNLVESVCETAERYCKGGNRQWESRAECEGYLAGHVRLGAAYELGLSSCSLSCSAIGFATG